MSAFLAKSAVTATPGASVTNASALPIASSSADGLSVDLVFEKTGAHLSPVDWVSGSAPPAYNKTQTVGLLDKTLRLDPDSSVNPTLQMHATELDTNVASSGIAVDFVSAHGEASIGSSEFLLTSNPASPRGMLGVLGLSFTASDVHSSSDFSHIFGMNRSFVTGTASFGSLSLGGALIGRTLTFSGDAAPNTVLFSSPTVTVTLDKQTVSDLISCGSQCATTPVGIRTEAIEINLHNATLFGGSVSGDIVIGESFAGTSSSLTPRHSATF